MIKKKDLSQEDKQTWEDYIKDPSGIYDKDNKIQRNISKERFKFDLHGFTLDQANSKVREVITYCVEKKYKEEWILYPMKIVIHNYKTFS